MAQITERQLVEGLGLDYDKMQRSNDYIIAVNIKVLTKELNKLIKHTK